MEWQALTRLSTRGRWLGSRPASSVARVACSASSCSRELQLYPVYPIQQPQDAQASAAAGSCGAPGGADSRKRSGQRRATVWQQEPRLHVKAVQEPGWADQAREEEAVMAVAGSGVHHAVAGAHYALPVGLRDRSELAAREQQAGEPVRSNRLLRRGRKRG